MQKLHEFTAINISFIAKDQFIFSWSFRQLFYEMTHYVTACVSVTCHFVSCICGMEWKHFKTQSNWCIIMNKNVGKAYCSEQPVTHVCMLLTDRDLLQNWTLKVFDTLHLQFDTLIISLQFDTLSVYRSGTVYSKTFVGPFFLRIKWKYELSYVL